jgi:predicted RNA-binding Zn-ribbon protein involved in translation (DUF1610 family)
MDEKLKLLRKLIKGGIDVTVEVAEKNKIPLHRCPKCGSTKFYIYCTNPLADQNADVYVCVKCGEPL